MISLNLLPPEEKKEANIKRSYLFIKNGLLILFAVIFFLTATTMGAKIILVNSLIQAHEQIALVNPSQLQSRQQIVIYNKKIKELSEIQSEFIPWSSIIWVILNEIPADIEINNLNIDTISKNLIIEGHASTRDRLLELEQNMESNPLFINPHLPLSNKLQKNNIDFKITTGISLENFKPYED